jgi:hypothetical protein
VSRLTPFALALAVAVLPSGPALAGPERVPGLGRLSSTGILLLPVRVDVHEVAPGGVTILKAPWTETAREHVHTALDSRLGGSRPPIVRYQGPTDPERHDRHAEVIRIHGLVQATIIAHYQGPGSSLPTKDRLAWSLGPGVSVLHPPGGTTTHAMFVELIERRLSRHFVTIGGLANEFTGTASIVDLATGDVLWFNHERSGGLSTAAETQATVQRLLRDLPF